MNTQQTGPSTIVLPERLPVFPQPPISFSQRALATTCAMKGETERRKKRFEGSVDAVQLTQVALQISPDAARSGNKQAWRSALRAAHDCVLEADAFLKSLWEDKDFVEGVEDAYARDRKERARAQRGERVASYIRLTEGECSDFDQLLRAERADPKLLERKMKMHLRRLKELGFEFYPLDSGHIGAVILKSFVTRYAKIESEAMRKKAAEQQRERRARLRNRR